MKVPNYRHPWWKFRNFLCLFCSGRRKGESEAPGGGKSVFNWKVPEGGGCFQEGEVPRAGRVSAANWGIFFGGC